MECLQAPLRTASSPDRSRLVPLTLDYTRLSRPEPNREPVRRLRSIYQYSNMAPRLSGQTSIFVVVFFVSKSPLGIEGQKKLDKFAILTRKPRSCA